MLQIEKHLVTLRAKSEQVEEEERRRREEERRAEEERKKAEAEAEAKRQQVCGVFYSALLTSYCCMLTVQTVEKCPHADALHPVSSKI